MLYSQDIHAARRELLDTFFIAPSEIVIRRSQERHADKWTLKQGVHKSSNIFITVIHGESLHNDENNTKAMILSLFEGLVSSNHYFWCHY